MIELDEPLVSENEAAAVLHVKPPTLTAWRNRGQGPAYVKVGRLVFYRLSDIKQWLEGRVVRPTVAAR
jgi:predicted DNA-binding transcriptional regulator AlpA